MKKYIYSLLITGLLSFCLNWALSCTTWSGFTCGVIVGTFGMFMLDVCIEAFTHMEEDDNDDDDSDLGTGIPYPQH